MEAGSLQQGSEIEEHGFRWPQMQSTSSLHPVAGLPSTMLTL
jgi:hypothetical protein